jgi:predicted nucleotidyltransferase
MLLQNLYEKKLIHPPDWLPNNTHYLTIFGSQSYGCSTDKSDCDIYGFAIPRKENVFPAINGEIVGFGRQKKRFESWQEHHVDDKESRKQYDFTIFSIIRYFQLLMDNNSNVLDSIWTPVNCVIHITEIGQLVRDNRKMFLHKGLYHRFRGYSFSQLHKMAIKNPEEGSKRYENVKEYGWDLKFGMNVVRLLLECEQLLQTGDMDIQRDRETLKAIRRGEWTEQQVRDLFTVKEKYLEELYQKSTLPYGPDEDKIKKLLLNCLEIHYGSLSDCIILPDKYKTAIDQINDICQKLKGESL